MLNCGAGIDLDKDGKLLDIGMGSGLASGLEETTLDTICFTSRMNRMLYCSR